MLDDLSVVLVASDTTAGRIDPWLQRLRASAELAGAQVLVAHPRDLRDQVRSQCGPEVARIEYDRSMPDEPISTLLGQLSTAYFTVIPTTASTETTLPRLRTELENHHRQIAEAGAVPAVPILLHQNRVPGAMAAAYIDHLQRADDAGPAVAGYLAHLALTAATVQLDWIEPRAQGIRVSLWLNLGDRSITTVPPWTFRATLHHGTAIIARSEPTQLTARTTALGEQHWNTVEAQIPLASVPPGDYRIGLEFDAGPGLRFCALATPTNGAIASARTVTTSIPVPHKPRRTIRYLLHTPASGRPAVLRIGRSGRAAALAWRARLVRSDFSYAWRGAADGPMRFLRLLRLVTIPFVGRNVWLIGERADEAQDNGYVFFEYLRGTHPRQRAYYILSRHSPRYRQIKALGKVIAHSSLRHRLLMLHARVLANAHSMHHMLPSNWQPRVYNRQIAWRVGALRVFLQHGVHLNPHAVKRGNSGYDVVLTSAERETAALRQTSGYDRQLAEVGLPRFDRLIPSAASRTILFMPTWRKYLPSQLRGEHGAGIVPFRGSVYQQFMTAMLTSARLAGMLGRYDYTLVFLPHYNVAAHFTDTPRASERITMLAPQGDALPRLIRQCDVLITDHSSIHFDVAYLRTPVIYAQFDNDEYERRHGAPSWFDFQQDGFGPVTYTLDQTLDALEQSLQHGARMQQCYAERVHRILTHHDQAHCARTYEAITQAYARSHSTAASG